MSISRGCWQETNDNHCPPAAQRAAGEKWAGRKQIFRIPVPPRGFVEKSLRAAEPKCAPLPKEVEAQASGPAAIGGGSIFENLFSPDCTRELRSAVDSPKGPETPRFEMIVSATSSIETGDVALAKNPRPKPTSVLTPCPATQ